MGITGQVLQPFSAVALGFWAHPRGMCPCCSLLIAEGQFVEIKGVGRLLVIAVHLVIDGYAIPTRRRPRIVILVENVGLPVQSDGLKEQLVIGCAQHVNGNVIPCFVVGIARHAGWNPVLGDVVPDIPLMSAGDSAFVAPNEAHSVEELIDVEFQRLREGKIAPVEVDVVGEIMKIGNDRVIPIEHAL